MELWRSTKKITKNYTPTLKPGPELSLEEEEMPVKAMENHEK